MQLKILQENNPIISDVGHGKKKWQPASGHTRFEPLSVGSNCHFIVKLFQSVVVPIWIFSFLDKDTLGFGAPVQPMGSVAPIAG